MNENFEIDIDLRPLYKAELPILTKLLDIVGGMSTDLEGLVEGFGQREVLHNPQSDQMVEATYSTVTRLVKLAENLG